MKKNKSLKSKTSTEDNKPEWSLKLIRVDNGYILEGTSFHPDDKTQKHADMQMVVEEDADDDTQCEVKLHRRLLWEILDYFGEMGSKHEDRLKIVIEKPDGEIVDE